MPNGWLLDSLHDVEAATFSVGQDNVASALIRMSNSTVSRRPVATCTSVLASAFAFEMLQLKALLESRGRREGRVSTDTRGPRANEMHGAGTTGSAGSTRPSLRDGLTAYSVLSLVTGLSCHHRPRDTESVVANLAPASGRQDHTAWPSAKAFKRELVQRAWYRSRHHPREGGSARSSASMMPSSRRGHRSPPPRP